MRLVAVLRAAVLLLVAGVAAADERVVDFSVERDPRGRSELTICTQNLANYGPLRAVNTRLRGVDAELLGLKREDLVERFRRAKCDVIAVQELLGNKADAYQALVELRDLIREKWNRYFNVVTGDGEDGSRCAFLFAVDKVSLLHSVTYEGIELPRLSLDERAREFSRAPLEIQLRTNPALHSASKILHLITFHFKSKRGGWKDPAALGFETVRMEMSEALRRIVMARHAASVKSGKSIVMLLGDRNSHFDSASARILEGILRLKDFRKGGGCRIGKRGVPLCIPGAGGPQDFFSVLTRDPETFQSQGTFVYDGVGSFLDDILLPESVLHYAREEVDSFDNYESGVVTEPEGASDHALAYVRLNW